MDKSRILRLIRCSVMTLTVLIFSVDRAKAGDSGLIILSNDKIEVGILPEVGGRIVLLRKPGLKNVLKSDKRLWLNPARHKPQISAFSDFKAFNGHIVWVGPQSEWWLHQDINIIRRDTKADWPPDPYLIYGKNEIIKKNDTYLKMIGPASPVSGVRLLKEISIDSSGRITFKATAENIRDENVSCDLWMLTRLDGFAQAYVPIAENGILELVKDETNTTEATPYKIQRKYFTYAPSLPVKPKTEQIQEAHLSPSAGFMAGFSEQQMLLIRFEKLDQELVHPKHGLVELYSYVNDTGDDSLLELEVHGVYRTLAPGEMMSLTETWELYPYNGDAITAEQIEFLETFQ